MANDGAAMVDALFFLQNLGAALLMGVAIGLERQFNHHPAGLRTNALVCVGAALFVSLSHLTHDEAGPTHMAAYVVSGIGFLGGGVILREGMTIKGMNTAATLWCTAAVGSFAGAGLPLYAAAGTLVVLALHLVLRPAGRWVDAQRLKTTNVETAYRIRVVCERHQEAVVRTILLQDVGAHPVLTLQGVAVQDAEQPDLVVVTADVFSATRNDAAMEELTSRINSEPGVKVVRWEQTR